jgi:hypothetical protein
LFKLVGLVYQIKQTQELHTHLLNKILAQQLPAGEPASLPEGAEYPLKTLEDFKRSEEQLLDPNFQLGIVSNNTEK